MKEGSAVKDAGLLSNQERTCAMIGGTNANLIRHDRLVDLPKTDLVARLRSRWPCARPVHDPWQGGGAGGYADVPTYSGAGAWEANR